MASLGSIITWPVEANIEHVVDDAVDAARVDLDRMECPHALSLSVQQLNFYLDPVRGGGRNCPSHNERHSH